MLSKTESDMFPKRKTSEWLEVCTDRDESRRMLVFNNVIYGMLKQFCKLRGVCSDENRSKSFTSLYLATFNDPIDHRQLAGILRTVLRAEMEKVILEGRHQIAVLSTRIKTLLSRMSQHKENTFLNINLWLMKKFSDTWSMASLM